MGFREQVSEYGNFKHIPKGYHRLGNKIILRSKETLEKELGEAILDIFQWCDGVFQHLSTTGESRIPTLKHIAGSRQTKIIHIENKVKYAFDISRIMFSGGNSELRKRLVSELTPEDTLLDMFSAVGNLSMQPIFYHKLQAYLVEKNEYTYSYLLKTLKANNIYHVTTVNLDVRELKLDNWASRIFMGYHNIDNKMISVAVRAAKSQAKIHLHPLSKSKSHQREIDFYKQIFASFDVAIDGIEKYKIKSFSPGLEHIEIIFSIQK